MEFTVVAGCNGKVNMVGWSVSNLVGWLVD